MAETMKPIQPVPGPRGADGVWALIDLIRDLSNREAALRERETWRVEENAKRLVLNREIEAANEMLRHAEAKLAEANKIKEDAEAIARDSIDEAVAAAEQIKREARAAGEAEAAALRNVAQVQAGAANAIAVNAQKAAEAAERAARALGAEAKRKIDELDAALAATSAAEASVIEARTALEAKIAATEAERQRLLAMIAANSEETPAHG